MEYRANPLLNLHLSQTQIFINKSKNNSYSDHDKKIYQNNLTELFARIKNSITDELDDSFVFEKQEHLKFICTSLEFLKDSTLNSLPFEVVGCLNLAMEDWIDKSKFIIVTSLNNNIDAFSYDESLAIEEFLYSSISAQYSIEFEKRLVQINLPLVLSRDYFSSVVLYHELGHFIDLEYAISQKIAADFHNFSNEEWARFSSFLPFGKSNTYVCQYHIAEYFCDIFASQYIGATANYYLQYLTNKNIDTDSYSHPSTKNRISVVNDFINGRDNPIVEIIQKYTSDICSRDLKKRYSNIDSKDFFDFIPLEITSPEQLHGIFPYAWTIWMTGVKNYKEGSSVTSDFTADRMYKTLNNLMEKSIGNYFIKMDWDSAI